MLISVVEAVPGAAGTVVVEEANAVVVGLEVVDEEVMEEDLLQPLLQATVAVKAVVNNPSEVVEVLLDVEEVEVPVTFEVAPVDVVVVEVEVVLRWRRALPLLARSTFK